MKYGKIKVIKDIVGGTLTVWFGNPDDEYICEESGDGMIIMKAKDGTILGFEYLHYNSTLESFNIETCITKIAG